MNPLCAGHKGAAIAALLAAATGSKYPWLLPFASLIDGMSGSEGRSVVDSLNQLRTAVTPIMFVPQAELPDEEAYEAFIARTARIPTRENLHDLLNGLTWLTWPQTKRHMNRLQAHEIAAHGVTGARGRLRDALTLFDENGAILRASSELIDALRRRDWRGLFVERRQLWVSAQLMLFGHALLEKLMQPRKNITAHVWLTDEFSDDALAASLEPTKLISTSFLPLPVLGVPGWWQDNERPDFYEDTAVFRPARQRDCCGTCNTA